MSYLVKVKVVRRPTCNYCQQSKHLIVCWSGA